MGKKNKKKKKKHINMPKLSLLDKCIYCLSCILLLCILTFIGIVPILIFDTIAFADDAVVACHHWSVLWLLVPYIAWFTGTITLWSIWYTGKKPLFGIRNYQYGPPRHPKIYPLFRKDNPPVWISESEKNNRRRNALILLVILMLTFIPYSWAFFGRDSLYYDGSISRHNIINIQSEKLSSREVQTVRFCVNSYRTGRNSPRRWRVQVELIAQDGKEFQFGSHEFKNADDNNIAWLTSMLALKRRFDSSVISFDGIENLEKVINDQHMTTEDAELLKQLFEVESI